MSHFLNKKSRKSVVFKILLLPLHSEITKHRTKRNIRHSTHNMVAVVQLVRASDCGSECRGFESHLPPQQYKPCKTHLLQGLFFCYKIL